MMYGCRVYVKKLWWLLSLASSPSAANSSGTLCSGVSLRMKLTEKYNLYFCASVEDPWHFGTDPNPRLWLMNPDPASIFVNVLHDSNQKQIIFQVFLLITFCTFTWFFKDKKSLGSHKKVGIKVLFTLRIRIRTSDQRIRIQDAQKHRVQILLTLISNTVLSKTKGQINHIFFWICGLQLIKEYLPFWIIIKATVMAEVEQFTIYRVPGYPIFYRGTKKNNSNLASYGSGTKSFPSKHMCRSFCSPRAFPYGSRIRIWGAKPMGIRIRAWPGFGHTSKRWHNIFALLQVDKGP